MERTISNQFKEKIGEQVLAKGWLHNLRELGSIAFLIMRDRGGLWQVVLEDKEQINSLKKLQTGSTLKIKATVAEANNQYGVELKNPEIEVIHEITEIAPLEIGKEELSAELDTILDNRPVVLRHPRQQAIFKVYSTVLAAFREALTKKEFTEFKSAKFMPEASEGGTNFFEVPYFNGTSVYLAQSPQFFKQMMVGVYERAFEIGPVFRAEKHNTSRHMSEYVSMDAEMGFIDSWQDVLEMIDYTFKYIINYVWQHAEAEMEMLGAKRPLTAEKTPQLKITEIHDLYFQETGKDLRGEPDLEPEEERFICEYAAQEWGSDLVFATHFPTKKRPFYTYPSDEDPEETYSADLLFRGLEMITGGQRIHNYDQLVSNAQQWGIDLEKIRDYLSVFKYGMPPHGGFAIGSERITMKLIGLDNVKEATLLPSDLKRAAGTKLKAKVVNGGENIRDEIMRRLTERELEFNHSQHEETPTSDDSARVRGTKVEEGVKALLLVGKKSGDNYLVNIQSHLKLDMKKVAEIVGEKVEMAKPEDIKNQYGLIIGGVPPFGNIFGIRNLFDEGLKSVGKWAFNCGLRTESIEIADENWFGVADAEWGEFAKE